MRRSLGRLFVLCIAVAAVLAAPLAAMAGGELALPITHQTYNSLDPFLAHGDGTVPGSAAATVSSPICAASGSGGSNRRVDCEGNAPDNETVIAVNPKNDNNLIGGANDYQLTLSGGSLYESALSRAHVSMDGGATWKSYPIPYQSYNFTGDPAIAFDATGRAYYATLGFVFGQGGLTGTNPDIVVSSSTTGGQSWTTPVRVAAGAGSFGSVGTFNDKEFIAAWGNGNAIVTWSRFLDGTGGSYIQSPIFASVTHDGGATWSPGVEISGSASFCAGSGFEGPTTCDQDQASIPTVGPDGSVYVAFENGPVKGSADFDDQYLVVQVDPQTGARIAGPFLAATMQDGTRDYPINVDGRQTYQNSQFRTWSAGNIAADPTTAGHLALTFSDMRNSPSLDSGKTDPYTTATNSDVFVIQSWNGGASWSSPVTAGPTSGDQFFPWAAYRPDGRLAISMLDRSYDSANRKYGVTLSTEKPAGSLNFKSVQATTALSDPTQNTRWFSGGVKDHATTFLGDYNALAFDSSSLAHPLWVDMRNDTCFTVRCGHDEQLWTTSLSVR